MEQQDLTLTEAREALNALQREIGAKCYIHAGLNMKRRRGERHGPNLYAQIYPQDMLGKVSLAASGDTWAALVADCRRAWEEHSDTHAANTIRDMALAIIRITADLGECTNAALRAEFDTADVARFGERACAKANEMAANGLFSIVSLAGANDAEAA